MCNASDTAGRYAYSKQPEVCKWNLQKLAEALDPALPLELAEAILAEEFDAEFSRHYLQKMRRKLGLMQTEQEGDGALVAQLLETMHLTGEWGQVAHKLRLSGSPSPVSRPPGLPLQGVCDFLANPAWRPSAAPQKWPARRHLLFLPLGKASFTQACHEPWASSHVTPLSRVCSLLSTAACFHTASVEVTTWFYFFVRILPPFKMLLTAWRLDVQPRDAICWLRPHRSTEPLEGLQPRPYLPKAPSPNTVPLRFGSPALNLGGDTQTPLAFWGKSYMVFWYFAEVSYVCT